MLIKLLCMPRGKLGGSEAVYALLDYAIRREYGIPLPRIEKTPHGKPYFAQMPHIHFSLSHTSTHVLCAVSEKLIGVDIEAPRTISQRVINRFASPEELSRFDPLDLWVLKESFIKLTDATLPFVWKLRFSMDGERITAPDPEAVSRLYRVAGCRAAVCALDTPPADIELVSQDIL